MSERVQAEAAKLWRLVKELEKERPSKAEGQAWVKKEMARLKAAYEKVTGIIASQKTNAAKGKARAFDQVFGGRPQHETADSLHDYMRDSKSK